MCGFENMNEEKLNEYMYDLMLFYMKKKIFYIDWNIVIW